MSDALTVFAWLFRGGRDLPCREAGDANASAQINLADGVYILQSLYANGPPPPYPFPHCGQAEFEIGCENPTCPVPF